jgi:hypothetical protein
MGKHDKLSHNLHIPKQVKFKKPKPAVPTNISPGAPQQPPAGTNAKNQFR